MQALPQTAMDGHAGDLIIVAVVFVAIGLLYILPSILAFRRDHPNRWLILVINLAFGGTLIGWGVALVWAMRAVHRLGSASSGGESGLNVFFNDVRKVQLVDPPPVPNTSVTQELESLNALFLQGAISQAEFNSLKSSLLSKALGGSAG